MMGNFLADEDEAWGNEDGILQKDRENNMTGACD